jgi:hypothetical protein
MQKKEKYIKGAIRISKSKDRQYRREKRTKGQTGI